MLDVTCLSRVTPPGPPAAPPRRLLHYRRRPAVTPSVQRQTRVMNDTLHPGPVSPPRSVSCPAPRPTRDLSSPSDPPPTPHKWQELHPVPHSQPIKEPLVTALLDFIQHRPRRPSPTLTPAPPNLTLTPSPAPLLTVYLVLPLPRGRASPHRTLATHQGEKHAVRRPAEIVNLRQRRGTTGRRSDTRRRLGKDECVDGRRLLARRLV